MGVAPPPHGLSGGTPTAGCQRHPGKTIKRSGERMHSLNRSFFVFIAPVGTYFVPQVSCGNTFVLQACTSQDGCRVDAPAAGIQGARRPLLRSGRAGPFSFSNHHAETACLHTQPLRELGAGTFVPARGREVPCSHIRRTVNGRPCKLSAGKRRGKSLPFDLTL